MDPFVHELADSLLEDRSSGNHHAWAARLIREQIALKDLLPILERDDKAPMYFCWLLGEVVERAPEMLRPVLPELFRRRQTVNVRGYRRSLAKWMYHAGVPVDLEGEILDELFRWAREPGAEVSELRFVMLCLGRLAEKYPDIIPELRLVLEEQRDLHTPTFRKQVQRMLAGLEG